MWISKDQWSFINDIYPIDPSINVKGGRQKSFKKVPKAQPFTDGVGTISPELADRIYDTVYPDGENRNGVCLPTAVGFF